ncbi:MAG: hypothetical protein AUK35_09615 [Zetaproteobacteria bacterium CG2_30_46_52]|nr:MAG: hypothetical protein AUK35_09615 [Zetaproteobacteria bacterium CG2_30_46_52]
MINTLDRRQRSFSERYPAYIPQTHIGAVCGAAALLFAKVKSKCEVLNDINGDLINKRAEDYLHIA